MSEFHGFLPIAKGDLAIRSMNRQRIVFSGERKVSSGSAAPKGAATHPAEEFLKVSCRF
jgi:hypothetical protein